MVAQNDDPISTTQVPTQKRQIILSMIGAAIGSIVGVITIAVMTHSGFFERTGQAEYISFAELFALLVGGGLAALLLGLGDQGSRIIGGITGAIVGALILILFIHSCLTT
jgi:hypothetical protein